jgi:hypothetical protein
MSDEMGVMCWLTVFVKNDYPHVVPRLVFPLVYVFSQILHRFLHRCYTDCD